MSASMKECLQLQLLEMEMLFSMFPNQGEVKLEDVNALTNIKRYFSHSGPLIFFCSIFMGFFFFSPFFVF